MQQAYAHTILVHCPEKTNCEDGGLSACYLRLPIIHCPCGKRQSVASSTAPLAYICMEKAQSASQVNRMQSVKLPYLIQATEVVEYGKYDSGLYGSDPGHIRLEVPKALRLRHELVN